jgi:hypothetical protein
MTKYIMLIIAFFLFESCSENKVKKEYLKFSKQISPSGKYIIYNYTSAGAMAFSSDNSRIEVFKINDKFEDGNGVQIKGEICKWISNDTLLVYNFNSNLKQPKDTLPIKTELKKVGDFTVKTLFYKTNHSGANNYTFDSVWTSDNNICIKFNSTPSRQNVRVFPLGSVRITTNSDSIKFIEIFEGISKSMNFTYLNKDGTTSRGLPSIGTTWFYYTPTKKISPRNLSKNKIFWEYEKEK